MQEDQYLVPDYYPHFRCKQGACRTPCCEGWPISVTLQDYFRLVGAPCSPELRRRLDSSLHICQNPTPERYAQICPRWDGQCPLHREDGLCMLHAELGEEALSAVCRLYPRGVRTGEHREASCANSCEAVVEMLLNRPEPLRFIPSPVQHCLPDAPPRRHVFHTFGREQETRLWLLHLLQDRSQSLPQRLLHLGCALQALQATLDARDEARLDALLSGCEALPVPPAVPASHDELLQGLTAAEAMLEVIDGRSRSVHDYGVAALEHFGTGEDAFGRYTAAARNFARLIPDWETWLEQLLVNHLFFTQFPFQDRPVSLTDEYLSLCACYALLRFLLLGWTALHPTREAAVDVTAAAFRLIDHTDFDLIAAPLMHRLGCDTAEAITALMML